jgi:diguanylate cyclase (GGDEF)-like protein/PAS domain S-box-containing protein
MAGSGVAGDARGRTGPAIAAMAAGGAAWLAGAVLWLAEGRIDAGPAAAVVWLLAGALLGAGAALLPGAPRYASGLLRTLVDGLIVAASILFLAWSAGLDELFPGGTTTTLAVVSALVQVTVAASTVVMLTRARADARPVLWPFALGLTALGLAAAGVAYAWLGGESGIGTALIAACAPLGLGAIAFGLLRARRAAGRELEPGLPTRASVFVPSVPFAAAVIAAAAAGIRGEFEGFLVADGAAVIVLVVMRQVLALWENISFWRRLETEVESGAEELRRNEARFRSLVQNSADVISVLDEDLELVYQSPSSRSVLGYDPAELVAAGDPFRLVHPDDTPRLRTAFHELAGRRGASLQIDGRVRHSDGEWRHVEGTVTNLLGEESVRGFVVNFRDISDRKSLEEQLIYRAFHDPLTALANRALFGDRLRHALSRRPRTERAIAVLFCDLDEFKRVNDSLGHGPGDRMLSAVAKRIDKCVRTGDTVARLGGDEFAVLLEEPESKLEPVRVAERILEALAPPFDLEARKVYIRASIGIAMTPEAGEAAEELLRAADVAMYRAKARGGGSYELFESDMHTELIERLELEADLQNAIERDQLVLDYQPIVALDSGEVRGAEALLRWDHPDLGRLPPARFIGMAEITNLIGPIGRWVMREACSQARRWQGEAPDRPPLGVSVNISAIELQAPGLVEEVEVALLESGIEPGTLTIEITESAVLETEAAIARLAALRELGVRIAVDDFGTGYSSLGYLRRLPVDVLKIDRSFLDEIGRASRAGAIVDAILAMSSSLGIDAVAEGVEEPEQARTLLEKGCPLAQGYYFGRPGDPAAIGELHRSRKAAFTGWS